MTDKNYSYTSCSSLSHSIEKNREKTARIPIKIISNKPLIKPRWIRVTAPEHHSRFYDIKRILRDNNLYTVCEEANCPNMPECFGHGTAAFLIMGNKCTRRCPFCDIAHGHPDPLDPQEPLNLAKTVELLKLKHVVVTSVDRDDLMDGGAQHFVNCIQNIKILSPSTVIEILTPDFRGRLDCAIEAFDVALPDVMNHNLETVPRLYKAVRPGADYLHSLMLLKKIKDKAPEIITKSGLMVGLGETSDEIIQTMSDLRDYDVDMITIGQYLQPSSYHLPVKEYVNLEVFKYYEEIAKNLGFMHAAIGPMVRSSYHADQQMY